MTSEADQNFPEREDFIDAIEYLKDPWNKEKLQRLLSDGSWKRFVAAANLSRDKADALYADLSQLEKFVAVEEKVNRERFMKEFPQVKQDLEDRIGKLNALADELDKMHRDCTITQVAASSTGAASGILTIAGLSLAPFTAGASLVLSQAGLGLGIAAGVTGVTANIVEDKKGASAKAEASSLMSTASDTEKEVEEVLRYSTPEIASLARRCFKSLQSIVRKAHVLNAAESYCIIQAGGWDFSGRGSAIGQTFLWLPKALGKGTKVLGAASAGVGFLVDVVDLVRESKHLHEGAKSQSAEELRQQAQELKRRLEELTRIHESLQEDLTP